MKLKRKAFTLVELIVVIAILAILAVTSFTVLTKWFNKARDSKRMNAVAWIKQVIDTYVNTPDHANFASEVHSKFTWWDDTTHQVTTLRFNDEFITTFNLNVTKAPKDPLNGEDYRFGIKYRDNPEQRFEVAATLEYQGDVAGYNAYVDGSYRPGTLSGLDGFSGLVVRYGLQTENYGPITAQPTDYVYNGSTGTLLPYSLQD